MELRGRTALVTGAAGGLAEHIARALAREDVSLVLSDLAGERLEDRTAELKGEGARAKAVPADLLDAGDRESLIERAESQAGPVDILVNNAGLQLSARLLEVSDREMANILTVNLAAPIDLIRQVVPGMLERGRGHVVTIASLAGKLGPARMAPYAISKAGAIAMTQSLRAEHATDPVGFSAVCPGIVAAGMAESLVERGARFPSTVPMSPPERVGRAVVRSIRDDLPEIVFVHRRPIRLVLALHALAPRFTERLRRLKGAPRSFRAPPNAGADSRQ
jgi:short-subunit dehydrogenase